MVTELLGREDDRLQFRYKFLGRQAGRVQRERPPHVHVLGGVLAEVLGVVLEGRNR